MKATAIKTLLATRAQVKRPCFISYGNERLKVDFSSNETMWVFDDNLDLLIIETSLNDYYIEPSQISCISFPL